MTRRCTGCCWLTGAAAGTSMPPSPSLASRAIEQRGPLLRSPAASPGVPEGNHDPAASNFRLRPEQQAIVHGYSGKLGIAAFAAAKPHPGTPGGAAHLQEPVGAGSRGAVVTFTNSAVNSFRACIAQILTQDYGLTGTSATGCARCTACPHIVRAPGARRAGRRLHHPRRERDTGDPATSCSPLRLSGVTP